MKHPVMALDPGDARIGVAATDPVGIMAHPVESIHLALTDPIERICDLVRQRQVKQLVIGLPLRMDGSEGTAAEKSRQLGAKLNAALPELPIDYVDERLTTVAASEKLRSAGRKAKQQRPLIDQAAAVEILNTWLQEHETTDGFA